VPFLVNILLTVSLVLLSFCWHSLVAVLISRQRDRSVFLALHAAVQDLLDWLLIFLAAGCFSVEACQRRYR
jgi:hypothetical protein